MALTEEQKDFIYTKIKEIARGKEYVNETPRYIYNELKAGIEQLISEAESRAVFDKVNIIFIKTMCRRIWDNRLFSVNEKGILAEVESKATIALKELSQLQDTKQLIGVDHGARGGDKTVTVMGHKEGDVFVVDKISEEKGE